jgi:putative copper resistance protein D
MVVCEGTTVAMQTAVLVGTIDLPVGDILGANFAVAGIIKTAAACMILLVLLLRGTRAPLPLLLAVGAIELAAATLTTHAAARLDGRAPLLLVEFLHQFGAAIWIGGIPCFLLALARAGDGTAWRRIGARFSRMSMAGVACIVVSGVTMSVVYIGSWHGFYGTAYGVMVGAKIAMLLMLLGLGGMNFLLVERLRARPETAFAALPRLRSASASRFSLPPRR